MSKRKKLNFDDVDASRDLALTLAEIQDAQDSIVLLVRGAIILDNLLLELLERYLHFADSAEGFDRRYKLFFTGKCELAMAVGLLSTSERDILLDFNRFRNKAAHGMDVHVHEDQVALLVRKLERYGWSPQSSKDVGMPLSPIDALRDVIMSLVGLLVERLWRLPPTGKLLVLGDDLTDSHWKKLGLLGALTSLVTISRERVVHARKAKFEAMVREAVASLNEEAWMSHLPTDEQEAAINLYLQRFSYSTDEIRQIVVQELEPLARRIGVEVRIDPSLSRVSVTNDAHSKRHPNNNASGTTGKFTLTTKPNKTENDGTGPP